MTKTRITADQAMALCIALEDVDPDGNDADLALLADRLYLAGCNGRSMSLTAEEGSWLVLSIDADPRCWDKRMWRSLDTALARLHVAAG